MEKKPKKYQPTLFVYKPFFVLFCFVHWPTNIFIHNDDDENRKTKKKTITNKHPLFSVEKLFFFLCIEKKQGIRFSGLWSLAIIPPTHTIQFNDSIIIIIINIIINGQLINHNDNHDGSVDDDDNNGNNKR